MRGAIVNCIIHSLLENEQVDCYVGEETGCCQPSNELSLSGMRWYIKLPEIINATINHQQKDCALACVLQANITNIACDNSPDRMTEINIFTHLENMLQSW